MSWLFFPGVETGGSTGREEELQPNLLSRRVMCVCHKYLSLVGWTDGLF